MDFKRKCRVVNLKNLFIQSIQIVLGTLLIALSTQMLLLPNKISVGGFSGLATITYYLFEFPVGTVVLALNIPLFIIALLKNGKKFFLNTVFGTILLSIFLNLFEGVTVFTHDTLLSCIYGGIISGIGTAIILRVNASTRWN